MLLLTGVMLNAIAQHISEITFYLPHMNMGWLPSAFLSLVTSDLLTQARLFVKSWQQD